MSEEKLSFEIPKKSNDSCYPIPLRTEYFPPPCGMQNDGNTCYSNAMLQALLTCSSIREVMEEHRDESDYANNPVIQTFLKIFEAFSKMTVPLPDVPVTKSPVIPEQRIARAMCKAEALNDVYSFTGDIWRSLAQYRLSQGKKMFTVGAQQDATEMFMYLSEILDNKTNPEPSDDPEKAFDNKDSELLKLFRHKYIVGIYCHHPSCLDWTSAVSQKEISFAVDPSLSTPQDPRLSRLDTSPCIEGELCGYLLKRKGYVDGGYKCSKCNKKGPFLQVYRLARIPSIIMVYSKVYFQKSNVAFPSFLRIPAKKHKDQPTKMMRFEAIAQIQHSGGQHNGHYWAIARRANPTSFEMHDSDWWQLNDANTSHHSDGFSPDSNTYCVFYHYVGNEIIK